LFTAILRDLTERKGPSASSARRAQAGDLALFLAQHGRRADADGGDGAGRTQIVTMLFVGLTAYDAQRPALQRPGHELLRECLAS
jgi:hypothetical protein